MGDQKQHHFYRHARHYRFGSLEARSELRHNHQHHRGELPEFDDNERGFKWRTVHCLWALGRGRFKLRRPRGPDKSIRTTGGGGRRKPWQATWLVKHKKKPKTKPKIDVQFHRTKSRFPKL